MAYEQIPERYREHFEPVGEIEVHAIDGRVIELLWLTVDQVFERLAEEGIGPGMIRETRHKGSIRWRCKACAGLVMPNGGGALSHLRMHERAAPTLASTSGGDCPHCGRLMSLREKSEQGACNDCTRPH